MPPKQDSAWIPQKEGDTLRGEVTEVVRAWSDMRTNNGRDMDRGWYPLLTVRTDDGELVNWHAFETVAYNRVLDKQPRPGETIEVTYLGESEKEPAKGMNRPKLYRLVVEGRDPQEEAEMVYGALGAPSRGGVPPDPGDMPADYAGLQSDLA